jgi:predicted nucleic acid-binding Zn finger protein
MKLFARTVLTAFLFAAAPAAQAEPAQPLSAADPDAFVGQLSAMGFAVEPVASGETPTSAIKIGESDYVLAFGGCTAGKDCRYVILLGKYSDVTNPPAQWVAKENADFDYIKVWLADDGQLTFSTGLIVEGMGADTFKASVQMFVDSAADLAKDAIDAGLTKRQAA